jgi:hypothetical protein
VLSTIAWEGDRIVVQAGRRTAGNAAAQSLVALLWPPLEAGGYSLIVDGGAAAADGRLLVEPTKAVLHRPGPPTPAGAASGCTSDCVRVA